MILKKVFVSLFLVMYVFVMAAMPVLGYDYSAESNADSSGSYTTGESAPDNNSSKDKAAGSSNDTGTSDTANDSAGSKADSSTAADPNQGSASSDAGSSSEDNDFSRNSVNSDSDSVDSDADSSSTGENPGQESAGSDAASASTGDNPDQSSAGSDSADSDADSSSKDKDSDQDSVSDSDKDAEKEKAKEDVTFSSEKISGAGVYVHASAGAGVLPKGTTMHLKDVSSYRAKTAADQILSEDVQSAQGVDISFHNAKGNEIEPEGDVNVSMRLVDSLEGQEFSVIHVSDNGAAENIGSASSTGASFSSDEFSLYVIAGTGSQEDPFGNVYREYTIGFGESITIYSDEKNHDGTWIPGEGNPAWILSVVTAAKGENLNSLIDNTRYKGTAYVQPKVIVTAKNKPGTIRVSFSYLHPEDKTHKTTTGAFIARHYYLIHIVDKSKNEYSVQFKNNDGTGVSHVTADMLKYTTESGVKAKRTVNDEYKHTFTFNGSSPDPSTRNGKVTLIMPDYPKKKTRTDENGEYQFIGWSILDKANPTTGNKGSIVYPFTDAHVFAPGDRFPLDRKDLTLWAVWARIDTKDKAGLKANFYLRIDDHIPNEPQSHGNASYTQIGQSNTYKLPLARFKTDSINGVDEGWVEGVNKPFSADVYTSLKNAGKLPADVTTANEFNSRYRVVWSTIKKESEGWHVDGLLYEKELYNLAYHENGDLVVVSSMPEGVKDIPEGNTTMVDKRIPNRYDMVFTGWNTEANGTGVSFTPGDQVVVSSHPELDKSINTLHLYAQWVKSTKYTYEVRYLEAGTNRVLKDPEFFGDQILGNKISSKEVSLRATSSIEDPSSPTGHYVFSYADPAIGDGDGGLIIGEDNSKNVITLYYMSATQDILATSVSLHKTNDLGRPLKGAEFELTKQGAGEATVFKSDEQGNLQIPFTDDPGSGADDTLTYTLKESKAPEGHIKSDDEYTIMIKRGEATVISFPGSKTKTFYPLIATVLKNGAETDPGNITVENKAIIEPIDLPITATKVLEGRAQLAGEFKFTLTDTEGKKIAEATNTADGQVVFNGAVAKEAGTYEFNISEDTGNDNTIQYDKSVYSVKVVVERGDDNILRVSDMTYTKDGNPAEKALFTNKAKFNITYDLNGGSYNGKTGDITEQYLYGTKILIHKAPTREGYRFLYWKGSEYQPGDEYVVLEDHKFVAQWEPVKNDSDGKSDDDPDNKPNNDKDKNPDNGSGEHDFNNPDDNTDHDKDKDPNNGSGEHDINTPDDNTDHDKDKNHDNGSGEHDFNNPDNNTDHDKDKNSKTNPKKTPRSNLSSVPETGDFASVTSLVIMMILSVAVLMAALFTRRKGARS